MITDLDETIRQLLIQEMPISNGEIDIAFDQPKREWSARLSRPTLNFFLYDLRENVELRQYGFPVVGEANGDNQVAMKRTPLRIDCHYMLTAWATEPRDEHRLIGQAMQTLFRFSPLPNELLVGRLQDQDYRIPTKLASHDKLTNVAEIWSALDNEIRPSLSYLVTLTMDPWTPFTEPATRSVTIRTAQAETEEDGDISKVSNASETISIAGTVRRDGSPLSNIRIAIKERGVRGLTDRLGRFEFHGLVAGDYTLQAFPTNTTTVEHAVNVPGSDYDINV